MRDADPFRDGAAEAERARRSRLGDLGRLLGTPEGERIIAWYLVNMGLGRALCAEELASYNMALGFMREIGEARPASAINILAAVFGLLGDTREI